MRAERMLPGMTDPTDQPTPTPAPSRREPSEPYVPGALRITTVCIVSGLAVMVGVMMALHAQQNVFADTSLGDRSAILLLIGVIVVATGCVGLAIGIIGAAVRSAVRLLVRLQRDGTDRADDAAETRHRRRPRHTAVP